jgi:hypothetical protein
MSIPKKGSRLITIDGNELDRRVKDQSGVTYTWDEVKARIRVSAT